MKRLIAALTLLLVAQLGCYNSYTISKEELSKLSSGEESTGVVVTSLDGESVEISPETPLEVETQDGSQYRITPFNFLLSETQLVSPDYDLLLPAEQVSTAEVREISYGKTFGFVGAVVVVVAGGFTALALTQ